MAIRTIILDFDGTIADTRKSIILSIQSSLAEAEMQPADEEQIKAYIGLPLKDILKKIADIPDDATMEKLVAIYRKRYNEIAENCVKLFPNVMRVLDELYQKGITITVASSKGRGALLLLLDKLGVRDYMTLILGEQDIHHKKPAPDMALLIMEETNSKPDETLVIGDTVYDIAMGHGAHCLTCGVKYGYNSTAQLKSEQPDYLIDNFSELLEIVN
jgi:phosphoglycolate phosphatase